MAGTIEKFLKKIVSLEPNAERLSRSIAIGMFTAFSPYIGLQTVTGLLIAYITNSNKVVATLVLYTVNNPWTMVPIAALDYLFGQLILEDIFGMNLTHLNPSWMSWVNNKVSFLTGYLGIEKICLWCFLIGGTILALIAGILSYLLLRNSCRLFIEKYSTQKA